MQAYTTMISPDTNGPDLATLENFSALPAESLTIPQETILCKKSSI